jgi:hypothetical protein
VRVVAWPPLTVDPFLATLGRLRRKCLGMLGVTGTWCPRLECENQPMIIRSLLACLLAGSVLLFLAACSAAWPGAGSAPSPSVERQKQLDGMLLAEQARVNEVARHMADGRYIGPLPLDRAIAQVRSARARLVEVAARHAALPEEDKLDHDADMRFFSLSKSGFPSIDATLEALERQRSSE